MLVHLVTLVVILAALGFFTFIITDNVPMSDKMKTLINGVVIVFAAIWVLAILIGKAQWPTLPSL